MLRKLMKTVCERRTIDLWSLDMLKNSEWISKWISRWTSNGFRGGFPRRQKMEMKIKSRPATSSNLNLPSGLSTKQRIFSICSIFLFDDDCQSNTQLAPGEILYRTQFDDHGLLSNFLLHSYSNAPQYSNWQIGIVCINKCQWILWNICNCNKKMEEIFSISDFGIQHLKEVRISDKIKD